MDAAALTEAGLVGEEKERRGGQDRKEHPYIPRNSKSGHQLIQNTWAGILSLSFG